MKGTVLSTRGVLVHCRRVFLQEWKLSARDTARRLARRSFVGDGSSRQRMAISRLATPSSPVTAGSSPVRIALDEGSEFGAQRLGMTDRQVAHRIAAVRLEAEALGDLAGEQIADHIFLARRDVNGARLERRQPVGVDLRQHAGSGAELQQRNVLALGHWRWRSAAAPR